MKQVDVTAVPSMVLGPLGCRYCRAFKVSAMPPADGINEAMLVNHGTVPAVSLKADGSQEACKELCVLA
jgi:hypothetical protein